MTETQKSMTEWADEMFGPAPSLARIAARANEEMAELIRAVTSDTPTQHIGEEIADVVIILNRLASVAGLNLNNAIDTKMQTNRHREWRRDGTGHGYHVR